MGKNPQQTKDGLRVLNTPIVNHSKSFVLCRSLDVNDFIFVEIRLRFDEIGRFEEVHELRRKTRRGPEARPLDQTSSEVTCFLFEFTSRSIERSLSRIQSPGTDFQQTRSRSVSILTDQDDIAVPKERHNAYSSRMLDDLQRGCISL